MLSLTQIFSYPVSQYDAWGEPFTTFATTGAPLAVNIAAKMLSNGHLFCLENRGIYRHASKNVCQ